MAYEGTPITRRSMLQMSWGGLAAAGVAAISGPLPILALGRNRVQDVTAETFRPYIGKKLVFQGPSEDCVHSSTTAELHLAEVSPHNHLSCLEARAISASRKRESFSLLFTQSSGQMLRPGLHRLLHTDFEDFQILLSRVGMPGRDGTTYFEAIFG